jgi:FAD binding domain/Berberine and berberine like
MNEVVIRALDGGDKTLASTTFDELAGRVRGEIITPEAPGYDEARSVWNAMIDRHPALIVRCSGVADVMQAVRFCREHSLLVSIKGAGHNIAGSAVCDGGVMIDLSGMRTVHVDPNRRRARVDPGVTLGDLDHETQAFGLATPTGINSTTGVAGLTLGGGFGWLSRKHGLTADNLRSADMVNAEGELVTASATENADLFWAIKGGGGNLGVVTSFEFDLHPLGPEILSGLIVHPLSAGPEVVRRYRSFTADMPDDLNVWLVMRKAPPLPFLPEAVHGTDIIIMACFYAGEMSEGERLLAPLRDFGEPIADVISPHPFTGWQAAFDPLLTPGARNYWKSHNFQILSDELLDIQLDHAGKLPSPQSEIFLARVGGAINRVASADTAYPHRDAEYVMNAHIRWDEPSDDERCVAWARSFFKATEPHATGGVYVNFIPEDEDCVKAAFGVNYDRLAQLKTRYDPDNLFRINQNVAPAKLP